MHSFKLNPTPRVLIVLTETAMKPIDAFVRVGGQFHRFISQYRSRQYPYQ